MQEAHHLILGYLATPNHALLAFLGGALLIYLECNRPGSILPGAFGTLLVLLALHSLTQLPIHPGTLFLLVAAVVLILLEARFAARGILALSGAICLTFATLQIGDAPALAIPLSLAFGLLTAMLLKVSVRARRNKFLLRSPEDSATPNLAERLTR